MSFRLVPNSVTLNSVKAITMRYFTKFGSFQAHYIKVVIHRHFLRQKYSPKNLVFSDTVKLH